MSNHFLSEDVNQFFDNIFGVQLRTQSQTNPFEPYISVQNLLENGTIGTSLYKTISGTNSDDILITHNGRNLVIGGNGNDTIDYSNALIGIDADMFANSVIVGYSSAPDGAIANQDILADIENITGSNLNDTILGNTQNNILIGNAGNDNLDGDAGNDRIFGDKGNDIIEGGDGSDVLKDGEGDDTYFYELGNGIDIIDDISGFSRVLFGNGIGTEEGIYDFVSL